MIYLAHYRSYKVVEADNKQLESSKIGLFDAGNCEDAIRKVCLFLGYPIEFDKTKISKMPDESIFNSKIGNIEHTISVSYIDKMITVNPKEVAL